MCLGHLLQPILKVKGCWHKLIFRHCEEWPSFFQIGRQLLHSRVKKWGALKVWVIWKWFEDTNKRALTTAWGWPKLRSNVSSAFLYINPQYVNSAMAVIIFPVKRVFKYVNLTSSVKDCEYIALSNCPKPSCHCRGSPLCSDNLHSGNGSFFLQVIASTNCFIKSAESKEGAEGVGCGGPPQQNGLGTVAPYVGGILGKTKVGGGTFGTTNWFWLHEVWCYVILRFCCCLYMKRGGERCRDMKVA